MKIRTDFVTNSSSTSFIIISKDGLTESAFLGLMGVSENSPMEPLFKALYAQLQYNMKPAAKYFSTAESASDEWLGELQAKFSDTVGKKASEAYEKGYEVFVGNLDSDGDAIESFFCMESLEVENDQIYFNALENYW